MNEGSILDTVPVSVRLPRHTSPCMITECQHQKAALQERSLCFLILRDGHQILMINSEIFRLHCNPLEICQASVHHLHSASYTQEGEKLANNI